MSCYNIIEVANTHGGNKEYLYSLIDEFADVEKSNIGIKFQPFHYDGIALKDFEWYPTYQKLFFSPEEWKNIIERAKTTKDIWLDLFDVYGTRILEDNLKKVTGIKLQTSVLQNQEVLKELIRIDISKQKLIINIAGRSLMEIERYISYFESKIKPQELLLEVGFQAYPTEFVDSGLGKIKLIKEKFKKRIVFADHIDGTHPDAILLPLMALIEGADVIEKHIMHSTIETLFDKFSSVTRNKFDSILMDQKRYTEALSQPFINERENVYLQKSIQIPVLNKSKKAGEAITLDDISFKRTAQKGLNFSEMEIKLTGRFVLIKDLEKGNTFQETDFRKLKIATIIAARLKSSRLKEKAKLKVGGISSVELCIKNALRFKDIDYTILATSDLEQDAELKNYTYSKDVIFHMGDAEDVIQRYLDVTRKLGIDVVIRVTGDNPYISADIAEVLMASHFNSQADYTTGKSAPIGVNLEIINVSALEEVKKHFKKANYSEYMTWYFQNNPEHFKLNFVELPQKWVRDYRLTLDYREDLDLFNLIEKHFKENKIDFSIDSLISFLDANPVIAKMNSHISLKFKTDQTLIDTLNKATKIPANANT